MSLAITTQRNKTARAAAWTLYALICVCCTFLWLGYMGCQISGKTPTLIVNSQGKLVRLSDFIAFYSAGKVAADHVDIYDVEAQKKSLDKYIAPYTTKKDLFIPYPPPFFVFMLPFTLLSATAAWVTWNLLGALISSLSMFILSYRDFHARFHQLFPVLALVASYPFELSISLGQTTLFMMAAITFMWMLLKNGRVRAAGAMAALGVMKLHFIPALLIAGTIFGGSGFGIAFIAASTLSWFVSGAIFGLSNIFSWLKVLGVDERRDIIVDITAWQNLRGQLHLLFGDQHWVALFSWLAFCVSLAATAWLWCKLFPKLKNGVAYGFELVASLTTLLALTFNPHCFPQDYVIAALPCWWLYLWTRENAAAIAYGIRRAIYAMVISFPLLSWLFAALLHKALDAHVQLFFWWGVGVETLVLIAVFHVLKAKETPETT